MLVKRLHGGEGANRVYWDAHDLDILARRYGDAVYASHVAPAPIMRDIASASSSASSKSYSFTISTGGVDRMGDTISPWGWQLSAYRRNPVVLFAHDAGSLPVGRATHVGVDNGKLVASMKFASTRMAQAVREQVDSGELRATSVGFRPLTYTFSKDPNRKFGIDFTETELLEFSIVPIPANPECLMIGASSGKSLTAAEKHERRARLIALREAP